MAYSTNEQISHVARRLGFGVEPGILDATTVDEAVAAAIDLSGTTPAPENLTVPADIDEARSPEQRIAPYTYWFTQMLTGPRRIEERLTWFWHDHFATSIRKVKVPYLMFGQHLTLRQHATGSFADMLYAVATDPAMLLYLDGVKNKKGAINENFGREVMELFTMGRSSYTEADVIAASKAFSGWIVPRGERAVARGLEQWASVFIPFLHDDSIKTLLGTTGALDAADAVDIILEQPATATFVGAKLYREVIGLEPDPNTTDLIAAAFRRDYAVMDLVAAIVDDPAFTSDASIRSKVRTPLERAVGVAQAFPNQLETAARNDRGTRRRVRGREVVQALQRTGYMPFNPPNVAGYPKGHRLLGPYTLVHGFDVAALLPEAIDSISTTELTERLGLFDLTPQTRTALDGVDDPHTKAALAINAPEYIVT